MKVVSICLSDIPKEKITKSERNGKSYISLVVDDRREKDQYGNDVSVYINQSKEERLAKAKKTYVGNGKSYEFNNRDSGNSFNPNSDIEDLPF